MSEQHDRQPPATLPKRYEPAKFETQLYQDWLDAEAFKAEPDPSREPFSIVIPPPNVTGSLHMGHAMNNTMQDILIRRARMQGRDTLWVPGTDHAGIATQFVVERRLAEQGITRHDLGREAFVEKVWAWKDEYETRILGQLKRLGASLDWSRTRFTMDAGCSLAVRTVFKRLYDRGLIYQGDYIVNWCPRCRTTLADLEVEHLEEDGRLYHIAYPVKGGGTIEIATTRPETMLGDTGVAVHPDDPRYQALVGKTAVLPLLGRELPIIADTWVDREFGSGAVKMTPGHDPNDFEIGRRHNLPIIQVIGFDGVMTEEAGPYAGLDRYECRERLVADLKREGFLKRVENHRHSVGHCYRCNTVIEPLVSRQWFVRMKPLAEPALNAVKEGRTRIVPERFVKIYNHWLENIRDWPVSRQIWWGHRIPAWYCDRGHTTVAIETPEACATCGSRQLEQDPDVLDTWFSSALWPFSTLGWPQRTQDLATYYPTSVLITGYDILFFWVARMMFMGLEFMGEVPFRTVVLHGLVRDQDGKKMSKSLGNVIDPEEVIATHGADALRWSLIIGVSPGNDVRLSADKLDAARDFANKLWNAARFVLMRLDAPGPLPGDPARLRREDRWILHRLNRTIATVDRFLDRFEMGEAAQALYHFIWSEFCDWYIELVKARLDQGDPSGSAAQAVLAHVLNAILRLLHPFMPFVTEALWRHLPDAQGSIVHAPWPAADPRWDDEEAATAMEQVMELIRALRSLRAEFRVEPGRPLPVYVAAARSETRSLLEEAAPAIRRLAHVEPLQLLAVDAEKPQRAATAVVGDLTAYLPLAELIDLDAEITRLEKEKADAEQFAHSLGRRLADQQFLTKAPAHVVEREQARHRALVEKIQRLEQRLQQLRG